MVRGSLVLAIVVLAACASKPSAPEVCKKLEGAGIARNCREVKPEVINARAKQKFDFDLVNVPGKLGAVLSFDDQPAYDATVKAYDAAAMLAGPHRYGNAKALIFVQLNSGASLDVGKKTRAIVDAL